MTMLPMGDDWATPSQRGGMFGGDVKGKLQAILASYLAAQGNPAGALFLRDRMESKQAAREEQQYQRRRGESLEDYAARQRIEQQFAPPPQPGEFEKTLMASGIQPGTPEWQKAMIQRRDNLLDPVVTTPQGMMLRSQITGQLQPQAAPPGVTFTPLPPEGGPMGSPPSAPFPPYYR